MSESSLQDLVASEPTPGNAKFPAFGVTPEIEAEAGTPVLSSNLVLGWHLAKLAGTQLNPGFGRLSE